MAKKKVDWRQGVRLLREGEPDKPAKVDMAESLFDRAALERDPTRRDRLLYQGMLVRMLGRFNKKLVDLKTYRPGRPKGSTREQEDAAALAFMGKTAAETGEKRPYRLARLAVEAGLVPIRGTEKARMDRLAGRWKRRIQK